LPRQALQEKLHAARPQAQPLAASRQQELAVPPEELVDAPLVWQRLGWEQSLRAPQAERRPALKSLEAELALRASLQRRLPEARQGGSARKQPERGAEESREEPEEEVRQQASCEPLWRLPLLLPCPLWPSVRPALRLPRRSENARAPLQRLLHRSSWNAFSFQ